MVKNDTDIPTGLDGGQTNVYAKLIRRTRHIGDSRALFDVDAMKGYIMLTIGVEIKHRTEPYCGNNLN